MYLQILLSHEKTKQSNTVTVYIRENSRKHVVWMEVIDVLYMQKAIRRICASFSTIAQVPEKVSEK